MKQIAFMLFSLVLASTSIGHAQGAAEMKKFPITSAGLDPRQFDFNFQNGELQIDYKNQTVTIQLNNLPKIYFSIVETHRSACGSTVINARSLENQDGIWDELSVKDNTTLICRILLPSKGTADLTTRVSIEGQSQEYKSSFILDGRP